MRYLYEFIEHQDDMPFKLFVNSVKHIQFHWHKEVEILYVLQGSVIMYLDQKQYTLNQDDVIVVNSMSVHKFERNSHDNILLTLQFGPEWLYNNVFISCNSTTEAEPNGFRFDTIKHDLAKMVWEMNKKTPGYRSYTLGRLQMLCGHLLRYFSEGINSEAEESSKSYDYKRLNRVLTYIDQNYKEKITLQTMAEQEHLSLHYFSHFFTDKIGIPFQKYLTLIRLEKAQSELSGSEKSITEIAMDCGFANVKLFNKYFKEKYGCTPSSYREATMAPNQDKPNRKPLTYDESSSGDYYELDTINAMGSLYRYLDLKTNQDQEAVNPLTPIVTDHEQIRIQTGMSSRGYDKHWNITTTAGRAVEGLRDDWRRQLSELVGRIPFKYIRFHGIFNDEMMVYNEEDDGTPVYNWAYVDKLYDFLLGLGIRPFVELGFMPTLLSRSNETVFWWKGSISPPADKEKWKALVREFVRHCINRYGVEEVKQWYFEVWNEPDLSGVCWAGKKEEYFSFYESTVRVIKSILPELKVGGPALGYGSLWNDTWAEEFMEYCQKHQVPLDFFSFHIYSEYPQLKAENHILTKMMPPSFYKESIHRLQQKMELTSFRDLELHITEWNFSLYDRHLLHDTMFMAPFVIYHAMNTLGDVKAMAFWCFTDVFEESIVPSSPFYGGFGLMNRDGLKKPSYYAFEFLQRLGEELIVKGDGYVGTQKSDGSMQLLLYHYVHVDHLFSSGDWSELSNLNRYEVFEEKGNKVFQINISHLSGTYKCTSYQLDRDHGSVFDEWVRMGAPVFLTEEELAYLHGRSGPVIRTEILQDKGWQKEINLSPHGILLLTLEKQF
ncbi:helix-turn-helix domain-containing protein [Paenibacillus sp. N3/727]|uniref:GH39 family glycosyl hydrolase n=1 Tax=Paenibacillus sp. N3/727 TaxID=2925845 RepID=UPI001F5367DF|nr:helix-turn-helix domain-containing protein [Paenibacillus sp. N3/727]UNK15986.1 helix-turn-helix domain-containing protein [Paenibacillus sp. N3/727]